MKKKIALLSDIHGNQTALEAVVRDSQEQGTEDYWLLGDSLMPGPGRGRILDILENLPVSLSVRGNWEDSLYLAYQDRLDRNRPSHLYLMRLCQFLLEEVPVSYIERSQDLPLQEVLTINDLTVAVSHHLPDQNWGRELIHIGQQADFDRLFEGNQASVAIYGHIHQQLLRYGSGGQLIINPGSIGQPFFMDEGLRKDLRAQYAIVEIDEQGLCDVDFRRVAYDVERELKLAKEVQLPYLEIYEESLRKGIHHTHNHALLQKISQREGYVAQVEGFFGPASAR